MCSTGAVTLLHAAFCSSPWPLSTHSCSSTGMSLTAAMLPTSAPRNWLACISGTAQLSGSTADHQLQAAACYSCIPTCHLHVAAWLAACWHMMAGGLAALQASQAAPWHCVTPSARLQWCTTLHSRTAGA
jgi:hypothetical protein